MARFAVGASKAGPKKVPTEPEHPEFLLGTRPPDLRNPRIKPMDTRNYSKQEPKVPASPGFPGFPGFGTTGQTRGS